MRITLTPLSRQTLSAIWHLFPQHRREELVILEQAFERAKLLIHIIHPNDEVAESILVEVAKKAAALTHTKSERGNKPDSLKIPLIAFQVIQSLTFDVLDITERFQEDAWRADAAGDLPGLESLYQGCTLCPYLKDALLEVPNWERGLSGFGLSARYIRKLVALTFEFTNLKRVVSGVARLAYRYTTEEVQMWVSGLDSNRLDGTFGKACSKSRGELLDAMSDRFGNFLRITKDVDFSGERCFQGQTLTELRTTPPFSHMASFCSRCLEVFAPWGVTMPKHDSAGSTVDLLRQWVKKRPEGEAYMVLNYALLHPIWFRRIVVETLSSAEQSVKFPDCLPENRLALPTFFLPNILPGQGGTTDMKTPLEAEEWQWRFAPMPANISALGSAIAEDADRRRNFTNGLLTIVTNGKRLAQFHTSSGLKHLQHLSTNTRYVEIVATDSAGEFPLLIFQVDREAINRTWFKRQNYLLELPNGQAVKVCVRLSQNQTQEQFEVELHYISQPAHWKSSGWRWVWATVTCFALAAILSYWLRPQMLPSAQPVAYRHRELPAPVVEPKPKPSPKPDEQVQQTPRKKTEPQSKQVREMLLPKGKSEFEQICLQALKEELVAANSWKISRGANSNASSLQSKTTRSSEGLTLRLNLYDKKRIFQWGALVTFTPENYREQARKIAVELNQLAVTSNR